METTQDGRTMTDPQQPPGPNPHWPPNMQPPPLAATPAPAAAPRQLSARRMFWTRGPGISIIIVVVGLVLLGISMLGQRGGDSPSRSITGNFDVTITSCAVDGDTATIGLAVKNNGSATDSATIDVEYRDSAGARLDTDTAYVRNIAPGDTARTDESPLLDAEATSGSCRVTRVR